MRFDTITTGRLILRRWRDEDRAPFAELNGDPETLVYFPSTLSREESDEFVDLIEARFERDGYGLWALEVRPTGEFIGFAGLAPLREDVRGGGGMEIGWRLARHAWHHGYATEAARAARDVAFDGAGLPELWSMTAVLNTPSQAVMRRIGMTEAVRFEHPGIPHGSPLRPHVIFHLLNALSPAPRPPGPRGAARMSVPRCTVRSVITWTEFARRQPALAAAGRGQIYQHGLGLGFLATVRRDGGPRVHPVCPVISPAGLHVLILPGPKLGDLRRDGRYSLHSEMVAPPHQDDGFAVSGRATEITGQPETWETVRDQVIADFGELWPDYDSLALFELSVESCLLTLTEPDGTHPKGPTIWKA